jgi:hypothetical protein
VFAFSKRDLADAVTGWLQGWLGDPRSDRDVRVAGWFVRYLCGTRIREVQDATLSIVLRETRGSQRLHLLKKALKRTDAKVPVSALGIFASEEVVVAVLEATRSRSAVLFDDDSLEALRQRFQPGSIGVLQFELLARSASAAPEKLMCFALDVSVENSSSEVTNAANAWLRTNVSKDLRRVVAVGERLLSRTPGDERPILALAAIGETLFEGVKHHRPYGPEDTWTSRRGSLRRSFVEEDVDGEDSMNVLLVTLWDAARRWADDALGFVEGPHGRECFRLLRVMETSRRVLDELMLDPGVLATKSGRTAKYYLQAAFFNGLAVPLAVLRPFLAHDFVGARYAFALAPVAEVLRELWLASSERKLMGVAAKLLRTHFKADPVAVESALLEHPRVLGSLGRELLGLVKQFGRKAALFRACAECFFEGQTSALEVMTEVAGPEIDSDLASRVCEGVLWGRVGVKEEAFLDAVTEYANFRSEALTERLFGQFMGWVPRVLAKRDPLALERAIVCALEHAPCDIGACAALMPHATGVFGLRREGLTCYVNAVLQTLLQVTSLELELTGDEGVAALWLMNSFAMRRAATVGVSSAKQVVDGLKLNRDVQADAAEFLSTLINSMEAPCEALRLELVTIMSSEEGTEVSRRAQKAWLLELPVAEPLEGGQVTLEDCVKLLLEPQAITGYEIPGGKINASRTTRVSHMGDFVFVQLERFVWRTQYGQRVKVDRDLDIGLEFDFSCALETAVASPYEVVGLIEHAGVPDSGHYTCVLKVGDSGRWVRVDDSRVESIGEDEVRRRCRQAYVLLFRRLGFVREAPRPIRPRLRGSLEKLRTKVNWMRVMLSEALGAAVVEAGRPSLTLAYITQVLPFVAGHVQLSRELEELCKSGLALESTTLSGLCPRLRRAFEQGVNASIVDAVSRMVADILVGQPREVLVEIGNFAVHRVAALRRKWREINRWTRVMLELDVAPRELIVILVDAYAADISPQELQSATDADLSPIFRSLVECSVGQLEPLRPVIGKMLLSTAHGELAAEIMDKFGMSASMARTLLAYDFGSNPVLWRMPRRMQRQMIASPNFVGEVVEAEANFVRVNAEAAEVARARPDVVVAAVSVPPDEYTRVTMRNCVPFAFGTLGLGEWLLDRPGVLPPRVSVERAGQLSLLWRTVLEQLKSPDSRPLESLIWLLSFVKSCEPLPTPLSASEVEVILGLFGATAGTRAQVELLRFWSLQEEVALDFGVLLDGVFNAAFDAVEPVLREFLFAAVFWCWGAELPEELLRNHAGFRAWLRSLGREGQLRKASTDAAKRFWRVAQERGFAWVVEVVFEVPIFMRTSLAAIALVLDTTAAELSDGQLVELANGLSEVEVERGEVAEFEELVARITSFQPEGTQWEVTCELLESLVVARSAGVA